MLSAVEVWLRDGRPAGTVLQDHDSEVPELLKNETVPDAIERHRSRVRELKADAHRIASSPFPSSYAKQQMRAQIDALAQRGAPNVANLIEHDRPVEFPVQQLRVEIHNVPGGAIGFVEVPDAGPLLAWLHHDALIKRLDQEIDTEADDKNALSIEARQRQEAEVLGDLLDIERQEAALVWQAQSQNLPVEHRSDINPVALLGLAIVTAPRADPAPGLSSGHAFDIVQPWRR